MAGGGQRGFTFGRSSRLKRSRDFARLRLEGGRLGGRWVIINWLGAAPGKPSRLGAVTSRRIGNAVARSRARRLLRETFRLHQREFTRPVEVVFVARPQIAGRSFAEVERDVLTTLRKAGLLENKCPKG